MQWRPVSGEGDFQGSQGSDPYSTWRLGAGAVKKGQRNRKPMQRPVMICLEYGVRACDFAEKWKFYVDIPKWYRDPILGLTGARWVAAMVSNTDFYDQLAKVNELKKQISRIVVLPPIESQPGAARGLDASDNNGFSEREPFDYSQKGTVVAGIIDYGIAFAHERFRLSNTATRLEYFWVQDAPQNVPLRIGPRHPVPYGCEIGASYINDLLGHADVAGEDAIYKKAAQRLGPHWLRSVSRRVAHGTHVADLACGYPLTGELKKEREQRPIVCVQLPEPTTADSSGENLDAYALDGIRYILERADEIARRRPQRQHLGGCCLTTGRRASWKSGYHGGEKTSHARGQTKVVCIRKNR